MSWLAAAPAGAPAPPPPANDPVFIEDFESWNTTTWRAMARNPYAIIAPTDHFIETSGSAVGSNHLRLFRAAKSDAGSGCPNNTVGWEIENNGVAESTGAEGFGNIMNSALEVWIEFYVKFDASPSSAPWGTTPDPAWECSPGSPDHKLLRVHTLPTASGSYIALKEGHEGSQHWTNHPPPTGAGPLMGNGAMGGSTQDWDNEWHLFRLYVLRSSASGVSDGKSLFTIDRGGSRVLLNPLGSATYTPVDEIDTWWTGWNRMQVGLNRNHWTNHDAQFRLDHFRIWTDTGNGGPGWINDTLDDAP